MNKIKAALVALLLTTTAAEASDGYFFPKLVVSGTAVLQRPADQVSLTMSIITQAESAEEALSNNNAKMQELVSNLQTTGLEKGEYFTGQFAIQPQYSPQPKNPPADWKQKIVSYEVTNSLTVRTQKMEHAPIIIDVAGRSGVNQISNISFGIKEPHMYRSDAISQATHNAIQDANVLASAANIKIVRILDIKLDQPQVFPRPGPNMLFMSKSEGSVPYLEAPDVDLSANVTVTFEIATK